MDAGISELSQCVSVGCSKGEILPSDRVSKACFQNIEMLLKLESSTVNSKSFWQHLHAGESVLPASILVYVIEITCSAI